MPNPTAQLLASLDDTQVDAFVEVMLLAAGADGELSDDELEQLTSSLLEVGDLWLTHDDLAQRVAAAGNRLATEPRLSRFVALCSQIATPPLRRAALELAVRVTAIDGLIRTSERELILELAEAFELAPDVAADIVRAVATNDQTRG